MTSVLAELRPLSNLQDVEPLEADRDRLRLKVSQMSNGYQKVDAYRRGDVTFFAFCLLLTAAFLSRGGGFKWNRGEMSDYRTLGPPHRALADPKKMPHLFPPIIQQTPTRVGLLLLVLIFISAGY